MLVLLNKNIEEYNEYLILYHGGFAYLYDLPESIIKKEILKGNLYKFKKDKLSSIDSLFDHGKGCIRRALASKEKPFTGKREPYIEYILMNDTRDLLSLIRYIKTITCDDIPDIEHLIYKDSYYVLLYALHLKRRVLKFEDYYKNNNKLILREKESELLGKYEKMFNIVVEDKYRVNNIFSDFIKTIS